MPSNPRNLNSIKRKGVFGHKLFFAKQKGYEDDALSMNRFTINLKVRTNLSKNSKKNTTGFDQKSLINGHTLSDQIDKVASNKKKFLQKLKTEKKENINFVNYLFGTNSQPNDLFKIILQIQKLEDTALKYYVCLNTLQGSKNNDVSDDSQNHHTTITSLSDLIINANSNKIDINVIEKAKNDSKVSRFEKKELVALDALITPQYRLARIELYRRQRVAKNTVIESKSFKDLMQKSGLKVSLARDLLSGFISQEIQTLKNIIKTSERVRETVKSQQSDLIQKASKILQDQTSISKAYNYYGFDTQVFRLITGLKDAITSYVFDSRISNWGSDKPDFIKIYKEYVKGDLDEVLEQLEIEYRQQYLQLRNLVGEQLKQILLIKYIGTLQINPNQLNQKCSLDFAVFNHLSKAVLNQLETYLTNENCSSDDKKSIIREFRTRYRFEEKEYLNRKRFKINNQKADLVVKDFCVLELAVLYFYAGSKSKLNKQQRDTLYKEFIDALQQNQLQDNLQVTQYYNNFNFVELESLIMKFPRISGLARTSIKNTLEALIDEQATTLEKSEIRQKITGIHESINTALIKYSNDQYLKEDPIEFDKFMNLVPDSFKSLKEELKSFWTQFVTNNLIRFSPASRIKEDVETLITSIYNDITTQVDTNELERNLLGFWKYKFLINQWLRLRFKLRDKERNEIDILVDKFMSCISLFNQNSVQQVYLADLLDVISDVGIYEPKDGEVWLTQDANGNIRYYAALRITDGVFDNNKLSSNIEYLRNQSFYSFKYTTSNSGLRITRNELDNKFHNPEYSQWQDFDIIQFGKIEQSVMNQFVVCELLGGNHLFKKSLLHQLETEYSVFGKSGFRLDDDLSIPRGETVITGVKLTRPLSPKDIESGNIYLRLTLLELFKPKTTKNEYNLEQPRDGRDLGENIYMTSGILDFSSQQPATFCSSSIPNSNNTIFFKQYQERVLDQVYTKGFADSRTRNNYRNKKKWILENIITGEQKHIIRYKSKLDNTIVIYEDNLKSSKKQITQNKDKPSGQAEKNNILDSIKLFNEERALKLIASAIAKTSYGKKKGELDSISEIISDTESIGIRLTRTELSSQLCINCGQKACTTKSPYRELAGKGKYRTANIHNNSEVAECGNCGFKTLCDLQAALNLAIFDWCEKRFPGKESDKFLVNYQNYIKRFELTATAHSNYNPKIKYNSLIAGTLLEDISKQLIQTQSMSKDKDEYKEKLSSVGAWNNATNQFDGVGFIRYVQWKRYCNRTENIMGWLDQNSIVSNTLNEKLLSKLKQFFNDCGFAYFNDNMTETSKGSFGQKYNKRFRSVYNKLNREVKSILSLEIYNGDYLTVDWLRSLISGRNREN